MDLFLSSRFLAFCLRFHASRRKYFIQNRILFVRVCGRCLERWGRRQRFWFGAERGGRVKWSGLQTNCKEKASFVALITLHSSNFSRAMVKPIYTNGHLGSFWIFLEPLVWTQLEIGRYIKLIKHYIPVELAAKFSSNHVAHLTCVCWPELPSISCFLQFCLSWSALVDIGLNSK